MLGISSVQLITSPSESQVKQLTFRVLNGTKQEPNGQRQAKIHIEIAEEITNPFFYYLLEVCERDFHYLKTEQSLLVDFSCFATKFIELLKLCESNNSYNLSFNLATKDPTLNILERNQFRNLSHLSLRFKTADDKVLKQYLASRLKQNLLYSTDLNQKLNKTSRELSSIESKYHSLEVTYEELKKESSQEVTQLKSGLKQKLESELINEKNKSIDRVRTLEESLTKENERVKKDLEEKLSKQDEEIDSLTKVKNELMKKNLHLDNEVVQLKSRIFVLQENEGRNEKELTELRDSHRELNIKLMSVTTEEGKHGVQIASLKEQLQDKTDNLLKTTELLKNSKSKLLSVESKLTAKKKLFRSFQKKLELSISEINKGNEIIERLQSEIKTQKLKLKNKNIVIKQQEKLITEHKRKKEELGYQLLDKDNEIKKLKIQINGLESNLKSAQDELKKATEGLESNQNVINYLNKQINKRHLGEDIHYADGIDIDVKDFLLGSDESRLNAHKFTPTLTVTSSDEAKEGAAVVQDLERNFDKFELETIDFDKDLKELLNTKEVKLPSPDVFEELDFDEENISEILAS